MMRKILILVIAATTLSAFGMDPNEEAIILNQELKFLEDSVNNTQAMSINTLDNAGATDRAINDEGLERIYFDETEEDSISTRTAGPKRRSY